jgi:hypothetical protein
VLPDETDLPAFKPAPDPIPVLPVLPDLPWGPERKGEEMLRHQLDAVRAELETVNEELDQVKGQAVTLFRREKRKLADD